MDDTIPAGPTVVAILVLVAGGGVAGTAVTSDPASALIGGADAATDAAAAEAAGGNDSIGPALTAFMQATTVEARASVESGLFAARFNESNASRRALLVSHRTAALRARLDELRQERQALRNATANDTVDIADRAHAARLAARIAMLQRAVNETVTLARRGDVRFEDTELDKLRKHANDLQRSEVPGLTPGLGRTVRTNRSATPGTEHVPRPDTVPNRSGNNSRRGG